MPAHTGNLSHDVLRNLARNVTTPDRETSEQSPGNRRKSENDTQSVRATGERATLAETMTLAVTLAPPYRP
jgi:hypothetical protein